MAVLRYAEQERANIRRSEARSVQQSRLNASLAERKADEAIAELTRESIGLGNVDNTSDADKPVSDATQTALNGKLGTWVSVPANASSTGTAGHIAYDGSYLYVCTAANTWVRTELVTW